MGHPTLSVLLRREMSKRIEALVRGQLEDFLSEEDLLLWDVSMVREGKNTVLRVFIDKEKGYIDTDNCEKVSKFLSEKLDSVEDEMPASYFLEVSSPGMDRELRTDEQLTRYIGEFVDIKLYSGIDGKKVFRGKLEGFTDCEVNIIEVIADGNKRDPVEKPVSFQREKIAKISLAVIF